MSTANPSQFVDDLQLLSKVDLTDAPEVTAAQAVFNQAVGKGPRRPRPARRGVLGFSEATLDRMVIDGRFPRPLKIGPRMVRWRGSVVRTWLEQQEGAATATT
jgi:predicted DNA-binding transcriptional regulator AlpA